MERRGLEADDGRRKKAVCEKVLLTCSGRVKTSFRFAVNKIEVSYGHGTPRRTLNLSDEGPEHQKATDQRIALREPFMIWRKTRKAQGDEVTLHSRKEGGERERERGSSTAARMRH